MNEVNCDTVRATLEALENQQEGDPQPDLKDVLAIESHTEDCEACRRLSQEFTSRSLRADGWLIKKSGD